MINKDSDLTDRINKAKDNLSSSYTKELPSSYKNNTAYNIAMRAGVDLVAATMVGLGLGMLCDYMFDSKPFGLIIFLVLGMGAGIKNIYFNMTKLLSSD